MRAISWAPHSSKCSGILVALKWRQLFVNTLIDLASYYFKDDRLIMIVSIRSSLSSIPEWAMLELNGELILPPNDIENRVDAKDSLELGSLAFQADSTPIMIVGGHELKGSIVKLQNPFAILKKRIQPEGPIDYEVVGVVSKKLLFDQYPKSIMR